MEKQVEHAEKGLDSRLENAQYGGIYRGGGKRSMAIKHFILWHEPNMNTNATFVYV